MRRPYHRVGGRSPFDGLEGGRNGVDTGASAWRLRMFSARKLYVMLACMLVVTAAVRLAGLALEASFKVEHVPEPRPGGSGPFGSSYTIRVNTFRRNDMLKGFVRHFSTCPNVQAIQVVWSDQYNKPPPLADFDLPSAAQAAKVQFEEQPTDSLNNRFRNLSFVPTPAVLSLDDDLEIPCDVLDFAYSVWQASPQSLVGFTPRLVTWEEPAGEHDPTGGYRYQSSFKYVWWHGRYNLVLTKCCFLHRDFLPLYFRALSPATLRYIDQHRNCEDIAMQFVVSNHTRGTPPVWVQARFTDHGQTSGISQGRDHAGERSACIAHLVKEFHHLPLTSTTHKAVDARRQWIW